MRAYNLILYQGNELRAIRCLSLSCKHLILFYLIFIYSIPGVADPSEKLRPWQKIRQGLEYTNILPEHAIHFLRVNPKLLAMNVYSTPTHHKSKLTAKEWANEQGLIFSINAGMYHLDYATHVGYLKIDQYHNNLKLNHYKSLAMFGPVGGSIPAFRMIDLDLGAHSIKNLAKQYRFVIQNLRLIKHPGENKWRKPSSAWSEAALARDKDGNAVFIFAQTPLPMGDFNRLLLRLPLNIQAAQHLDGGRVAQLYVQSENFELFLQGQSKLGADLTSQSPPPLPFVIGIPRS